MLNVKIKKLNQKAVIPQYATTGSAGLDMTAVWAKPNPEKGYIEYGTGLSIQLQPGYVGLLFPRSSISSNTTLSLANSVGVLDSDYTGEIVFRFRNVVPGSGKIYKVGERIGQILIMQHPEISFYEVDKLDMTARGDGGHGSTGQ